MKRIKDHLRPGECRQLLFVALCFGLCSAVYLSWLDRLVTLAGTQAADWWSLVAGYLLQAAGVGVTALTLRRGAAAERQGGFLLALLSFMAVAVPTLVTGSLTGVIVFGLLMNALCGVIAGYYLLAVAAGVSEQKRSAVFGGGYAIATVAVGLLALAGRGALLHGRFALLLYAAAFAGLAVFTRRYMPFRPAETEQKPDKAASLPLVLACGVVFLVSLVKNLGFGFPSTDIEAGLIPEISRLPYALGLIAAGLINDKNRRYGMLCTLSALIVPFLMLGLAGEPVSSTIFWGLDYIFFAFFTVFRTVLFLDLAARSGRWALAPLGLLLGRAGDAAGTALNLLLAGHQPALIALAGALFVPSVFLLYRLYRQVYEPEAVRARSEEEVFEEFCLRHDLSARERDIFRMLAANSSNTEIADRLYISENTVKFHVRNVLQKTGCKNRLELQRKYVLALHPELQTPEGERPELYIVS